MGVAGRYIGLFMFWVMCCHLAQGQYYYEESPDLHAAYELILDLRLDSARQVLQSVREEEPQNLLVEVIDSYVDFLRSFLDEDEASFHLFTQAKQARLKRLEHLEVDSPWAYFSQAEINLQYAIVRSKHGEFIKAGWDINRAYKLLKKCKKEYPHFILADKSLSIIHAMVGSIKGFRKSLVKIFTALDGSVEQGLQEIKHLVNEEGIQGSIWRNEILIIRSLLAKDIERDLDMAHQYISQVEALSPNSPFIAFLKGSIEVKLENHKVAIESWTYDWRSDQHRFYYLDLVKGIALLNQLDPSAEAYLERYIHFHPGLNYQHEARQKLAWYELLINNNVTGYHKWMNAILELDNPILGEDEQALHEAESNEVPHRDLLRVRLLYDAGEYSQARKMLKRIVPSSLSDAEHIEYQYRSARIYHALNMYKRAIKSYITTMELGVDDGRYYACNAALQIGYILQQHHKDTQAKYYFERCLSFQPEEYKSSLHQKARLAMEVLD